MAKYNLQPNEAVLHTSESAVQRGTKLFALYTGELVLTNLHIIWVNKNTFGKVKEVEYLPLALIKVHADQAQARLTKNNQGLSQLEVYFQNGEEVFKFQSGKAREIEKWIDAINRAVTGNGVDPAKAPGRALPGTGAVAETLRDTFSHFKSSFGGGAAAAAPQRMSSKCSGCGASISGMSGTVVKCQYCDSESRLP